MPDSTITIEPPEFSITVRMLQFCNKSHLFRGGLKYLKHVCALIISQLVNSVKEPDTVHF